MMSVTFPAIGFDHNDECIGCGAHIADACSPTCPRMSGDVGRPEIVLRAAVRVLRHYPHVGGRVGYDLPAAILGAASAVGVNAGRLVAAHAALRALASHLRTKFDWPTPVGDRELVCGFGRHSTPQQIGVACYAAAATHLGVDFDPEDFGTLPA